MKNEISINISSDPKSLKGNVSSNRTSSSLISCNSMHKKRGSVMIMNLQSQYEKGSRLLKKLCSSSVKGNRPPIEYIPSLNQYIKLPLSSIEVDLNSDITCPTPFHNEILRTITTPVTHNKSTRKKLSGSSISFPEKPNVPSQKSQNRRKKATFIHPKPEGYKLSLSPRLKKRHLSTQEEYLKVFDKHEIYNISNGKFLTYFK